MGPAQVLLQRLAFVARSLGGTNLGNGRLSRANRRRSFRQHLWSEPQIPKDLHGCCSGLFRFSGRIDNPFALSELNGAAIAMSRPVLACRCCAVAVETARTLASFPSPRRKRRESLYIGSRFPQSISAGLRDRKSTR